MAAFVVALIRSLHPKALRHALDLIVVPIAPEVGIGRPIHW